MLRTSTFVLPDSTRHMTTSIPEGSTFIIHFYLPITLNSSAPLTIISASDNKWVQLRYFMLLALVTQLKEGIHLWKQNTESVLCLAYCILFLCMYAGSIGQSMTVAFLQTKFHQYLTNSSSYNCIMIFIDVITQVSYMILLIAKVLPIVIMFSIG